MCMQNIKGTPHIKSPHATCSHCNWGTLDLLNADCSNRMFDCLYKIHLLDCKVLKNGHGDYITAL